MELTQHEQKILDIINSNPEILDDPVQRSIIAQRHGLTEKTLRNRIAEFKKYGLIHSNNQVIPTNGDIDIVQIFQLIWQKKINCYFIFFCIWYACHYLSFGKNTLIHFNYHNVPSR